MPNDIQDYLLGEFVIFLLPLKRAAEGRSVGDLLAIAGWDVSSLPPSVASRLDAVAGALQSAVQNIEELATSPLGSLEAGLDAASVAGDLLITFASIAEISTEIPDGDVASLFATAASDVLGHLTATWMKAFHPVMYGVCETLGFVLDETDADTQPSVSSGSALVKAPVRLAKFSFDRLPDFFRSPGDFLATEYVPTATTAPADIGRKLFPRLLRIARGLSFAGRAEPSSGALVLTFEPDDIDVGWAFRASFGRDDSGMLYLDCDPSGAVAIPYSLGIFQLTITAGVNVDFKINRTGVVGVSPGGSVGLSIANNPSDAEDWPKVFGGVTGTRLAIAAASAGVVCDLSSADGSIEFIVSVSLDSGTLTLAASDQDGFLAAILPADGVTAPLDIGVGWSSRRGFFLLGNPELTVTIPLQLAIGPVSVTALTIEIGASATGGGSLRVGIGVDMSAQVGPVGVTVNRIGVTASLALSTGNLGNADVRFGVEPPTGLGLSVDAGPLSGGGFIDFDPAHGRYFGALSLLAYDISISAIGLIETQPA